MEPCRRFGNAPSKRWGLGRPAELLKRCGYRDSVDVAEAYRRGTLGAVAGLGDTTLARIRDWVAKNPGKRAYVLNPAATMQRKTKTKTTEDRHENQGDQRDHHTPACVTRKNGKNAKLGRPGACSARRSHSGQGVVQNPS